MFEECILDLTKQCDLRKTGRLTRLSRSEPRKFSEEGFWGFVAAWDSSIGNHTKKTTFDSALLRSSLSSYDAHLGYWIVFGVLTTIRAMHC